MTTKALIMGVEGPHLSAKERAFFEHHRPWGFILFARNIGDPAQVRQLCSDLRQTVGRDDAPILLDQEGGRVQRLRPPHWYQYPAAQKLGELYETDRQQGLRATWLLSRLHAFDLLNLGISVDCLPVLDVPSPDGHNVIGDRAYGSAPDQVAALGRAACDGLMAGGVMPVIKHIPGHGRATADSHHELPKVTTPRDALEKSDFKPFAVLADIKMAMTAHVIYSAIDPVAPATTSKIVMDQIVRGFMGYDGLVMCDDITMGALSGDLTQRTLATIEAGCDIVLHCTGKFDEMQEVATATPELTGKAAERAKWALEGIGVADDCDEADCRAEFSKLMNDDLVANAAADPTNYGPTGRGTKTA